MVIRTANLSSDVADVIRQMIVDGRLGDGARINEVHLSEELNVSRTPLREALGRLGAEGALYQTPRVGYFVAPLSVEEAEQIYPIRPLLDPEALRLAGIPSDGVLSQLEDLNRQITAARTVPEKIELYDSWHLLLLSGCPNRVLVGLIEHFIRRTRRYELALFREAGNVAVSTLNHDQIVRALRAKDLEKACDVLRQNLTGGLEPIISWLRSR